MADDLNGRLIVFRGILGPVSGTTANLTFQKNNILHKKKEQKTMAQSKHTYAILGQLQCNDRLICDKVRAYSKREAKEKFRKDCKNIIILCVKELS